MDQSLVAIRLWSKSFQADSQWHVLPKTKHACSAILRALLYPDIYKELTNWADEYPSL